jgi:hypothetical protein
MPPHAAKVLLPCLIFSTFKGDNCQKSLDQQFQPNKVTEWKLKISYFSPRYFQEGQLCQNQQTITKFKLDLRIPMMYLYMQFQPYTCIQTKI